MSSLKSQLVTFWLVLLDAAKRDNIAGYKKFISQSENSVDWFVNWVSVA